MSGNGIVRRLPGPAVAWVLVLTVVLSLVGGESVGLPAPAAAAPSNQSDDEHKNKDLHKVLAETAKAHLEAEAKLDASVRRQAELSAQLRDIEARLIVHTAQVGQIAAESYRLGRLTPVSMLLNSTSPEAFLDRAEGLETLAQRDARRVRDLAATREDAARAEAAIQAEVLQQRKQVAVMAAKKKDAERALAASGGGGSSGSSRRSSSGSTRLVNGPPRNSDGSWPRESCSEPDPTTERCLTPRTLYAYQQARSAGFRRYTSCYRGGGGGEHPLGRACDFSAARNGFENRNATGGDRTYGNNLTDFFVRNAKRLGVLYVIWYREIWHAGIGWDSYNGGSSPAGAHTNHVHLSMY